MPPQRFELFVKKLSDEQLDDLLAGVMAELRAREATSIKSDFVSKSQALRLKADQTTESRRQNSPSK